MLSSARLDVQRALLADHAAPVAQRVPENDLQTGPLFNETVAMLREVLTAVESSRRERIEAAVALADVSPRLTAEVADFLGTLVTRNHLELPALIALAGLDGPWRAQVIDTLEAAMSDRLRSTHEHYRAVDAIMDLDPQPSEVVRDFLRTVASSEATPDVQRVKALFTLRGTDGLGRLRDLRDDARTSPAARWAAVTHLINYAVADRAVAFRILRDIATDTAVRPALRWRAADDLSGLGPPGRDAAVAALSDLLAAKNLPPTTRTEAARLLLKLRPNRPWTALAALRELAATGRPLHRVLALRVLGSVDPTEPIPQLRDMAADMALGPVARLRSAETLAYVHRDHRETAAIIARNLMTDTSVPQHIRCRAARNLARWSELCRDEARAFLRNAGRR